jgi:hypothetical protein
MVETKITIDENGTYVTPTRRQLDLFARTKKEVDGPKIDRLLLDLAGNSVHTDWNKRAAYVFADFFVGEIGVVCTDPKVVREVFRSHLVTLAKQYRDQTANSDTEEERVGKIRRGNTQKARANRQRSVRLSHFF